jgi:hypothetical protein
VIGDAIHNLRATLDHLIYGVTGTDDSAFPIYNSRHKPTPSTGDLRQTIKNGAGDAPPALRDALLDMDLHRGGRGARLWLLHHLDIVDKHRLVLAAAVAHHSVGMDMNDVMNRLWKDAFPDEDDDPPGQGMPPIFIRPQDRELATDGMKLFTAPADMWDQGLSITPVFEVVFIEPEEVERQPVVETLEALVTEVDGALTRLRPLC